MKMIVVDDEKPILHMMQGCLEEALPDSDPAFFNTSSAALEYARKNYVDVAFLDINMPVINGVELAKQLKKIHPRVNVIFCTAYTEFMQDAIDLHASGYLLKPASAESIEKALSNLLHPTEKKMPKVFARTFGDFDLFIDGASVSFESEKSKEFLAYLIHKRGAVSNKKEIYSLLFGDNYSLSTQSNVKKVFKELMSVLSEHGAESIINKWHNQYAVDTTKFSCDAYDYDKGIPYAINAYEGVYMTQYEWALFN